MAGKALKKPRLKRTTMWLSVKVMDAATKRAAKLGVSRRQYVEALVRKDLGLEAVDLEESAPIFG